MTDWNHTTPLAGTTSYAQAMIPLRVEGADPTNPALDSFQQLAVETVIAAAANAATVQQTFAIDLFANLAQYRFPSGVASIITSGATNAGVGGGIYVSDALATAAFASAHPAFCAADGSGRYWRLAPADGTIAISQGGALGGANNDQAAVQASLDYAKAIGARTVLFDFDNVSIWSTLRTSVTTDEFAQDGQSIWVTAPVRLLGLPTRTHVQMLSTTGASLETGWQNVGGNVWRGSGVNLIGGTALAPAANGLSWFVMENIWLDGGCAYTGVRTAPTPASPDGPDLTNKGIRLQDSECDAITLVNCKISGFKGEAYYAAGTTQTYQRLRDVEISGSNQSGFNPSTGYVDALSLYVHDCYLGVEQLGGIGGRIEALRISNTIQSSFTGGPANGLLYNYAYPTRAAGEPPWLDLIGANFENAGQIIVGSYVRIPDFIGADFNFQLITDTAGAGGDGALTSCYIKGCYTVDQMSMNPIVNLTGPANDTTVIPGATGSTYIKPPSDVHINLDVHRSANAIANGEFAVGITLNGEVDQNSCSFHVGDADGLVSLVNPTSNIGLPLVTLDGPTSSHLIGSTRPLGQYPAVIASGTSYALTVSNPRMSLLNTGAAATIAITMAAPFAAPYGFAFGQKCRIYYDIFSTIGSVYTFAHNGGGLRLNADCTLAVGGDWLEVEFNAVSGLWQESGRSIHAA